MFYLDQAQIFESDAPKSDFLFIMS